MKNGIIAVLATYIFWTQIAVIHPLPVLPIIVFTFWMILTGIEDLFKEYSDQVRRGRRLQRKIKRAERGWYLSE